MSSLRLAVAVTATSSLAAAQAPAHAWIDYDGRLSPSSVAPAGDWNGDGIEDLFVGSRTPKVVVLSGVDRAPLQVIATRSAPWAIQALGDVDADGVVDLLVGEPYDGAGNSQRGAARVYSGGSGALLHESLGSVDGGLFGLEVHDVFDVDGDGVRDFAASSISTWLGSSFTPYAQVVSGRTGAQLYGFTANGESITVDAAGDVDGDGFADLLRTDAHEFVSATQSGRARVISGRTGNVIRVLVGNPGELSFGSLHAWIGDLDGDGIDDVALGTASSFRCYSGSNGSTLLQASMPGSGSTSLPISRIVALGDANGDGAPDIAAYCAYPRALDVISGATGSQLYRKVGLPDVWSISPAIDLNRDGLDDLVLAGFVGSYYGHFGLFSYSSGWSEPAPYCVAKTSSAGCIPRIAYASGGTSLSVGDDLEVCAHEVQASTKGFLAWSTSSAALPFHGGTLCLAPSGSIQRTPVQSSGSYSASCDGTFRYVFRRAYLATHFVTPGTTLYAQFISRDPGFAPPNDFGLTDALAITFAP